jgi:hypothetical protein
MKSLIAQRLAAHALAKPARSVLEVARHLGALQAQDFAQSQWALAVRCRGGTASDVARAFSERQLLRTWAMRGTLHVVPAEDAAWLVRFCAKRNLPRAARRLQELKIGTPDLVAARRVVEKVLRDEGLLREEVFMHLERAGQATAKQRGVHLLWHLAQEGLVGLAGERFVLLEGWVPRPRRLEGDQALGELAARYFRGHGPASLDDFAFWAGLPKGEAKRAQELAAPPPPPLAAEIPEALLLPGFDEYFLGYADRSSCIDPAHLARVVPGGNGVFLPMLLVQGRVRGTWRRRITPKAVALTVSAFLPLSAKLKAAIEGAAEGYATFHGKPVAVSFAD